MATVGVDFDANSTLGALLCGMLVSCTLFGVLTVQCYNYNRYFPQDIRMIKFLVLAVWFLELGHTIAECHAIYTMLIIHFGRADLLLHYPASYDVTFLLSGCIAALVQVYLAIRVRLFSGNLIIPVICWILSLSVFVFSVLASVEALIYTNAIMYVLKWDWLISTTISLSAVVDIIIAATLCYFLLKRRNRVHERTARVMEEMVAWTLQTGLLTSLSALSVVCLFQVMKFNFVWLAMFAVASRLYGNSLLALLNARYKINAPSPREVLLSHQRQTSATKSGLRSADITIPRPIVITRIYDKTSYEMNETSPISFYSADDRKVSSPV